MKMNKKRKCQNRSTKTSCRDKKGQYQPSADHQTPTKQNTTTNSVVEAKAIAIADNDIGMLRRASRLQDYEVLKGMTSRVPAAFGQVIRSETSWHVKVKEFIEINKNSE